MSSFQNQDNFTDKLASLNLNSTEESVLKEYRKNDEYYKAALLSEIISVATKNIISSGEIDDFKKYLQFIIGILNYEKEENPKKFNETIKDAIKNTNFIILACKYNKIDILTFMMDEKNQTYSSCCQPGNYDKENHNAFYYTIRDDRKDFIEVLLDEWPGYVNSEEVYRALADAYAEADLQMLTLSDELIMFIAERSIDHYFYSDDQEDKNIIVSLPDIKERGKLLIESIRLFIDEYSNSNDLNSILSLRSKFITYNINILKQQMKATYSKIFWEEIEFYLLAFVTSRENSKVENMNLLKFLMPKSKLLHYLDLFASILENEMKNIDDQNLDTLKNYPRESRVKMIPKILKSNPKVREFYEDYQRVKDACALNLISHSVDISLNSYSDEKDKPVFLDTKRGQMAVKRTLQIIAEMMKNNWESPNMTRSLSLLLLTTLSSRTRQIVVNFHNSSFIHTQTRKLGKGNSNDPNEETIFKNIQADLKLIEWMTRSILHVTLIHYLTVMLETIVKIKTPEDLRSYINSLDLDFITEWYAEYEVDLNWNYDTLISEFNNLISRIKTDVDDSLESLEFLVDKTDIRGINAKDRFEHVDYLIHFKRMCSSVNKANFNSYFFQKIKTEANFALDEKLDEKEWKIGSNSTSYHILNYMFTAAPRLISSKCEHMVSLSNRIFVVMGHGLQSYDWLDILSTRLWTKKYLNMSNLDDNINFAQEKKELSTQVLNDYNSKVEILKNILTNHKYDENLDIYQNLTTQAAVEMLTLELMSIMDASKNLVDNYTILDNSAPILVGKILYNYLARSILTFQIFDSDKAIVLNAKKLCLRSDEINEKKIGKIFQTNIKELEEKHSRHLSCLINQNEMFQAIEQGDIKRLECAINTGADINGSDCHRWSSLHFAAKGGNLAIFQHLMDLRAKNKFKNMNGESSLHIAAKYGQIEIVKWFMRDVKNPGVLDNSKVTSLHFAVRFNQIEIVKILLQSKTELSFKELIHLAVLNNSKDVVEFLVKNSNEQVHCCLSNENQTPLHIAAKNGYAELTQYLISLQPDVNCRSDGEVTPLLDAAVYGHVETVKILLSNNADVNIGSNKGTTALHVAAQYGHEEVVKVLLENGADVNKTDIDRNAALHFAAKKGSLNIVKLLIKHKADVNVKSKISETPLILAVFNGYPEIVQLLLEKKSLDIPYEESGNSAVHLAAMNGNIEVMRLLFRQKGQLKKRNVFHENPLYLAARYGHLEVVKFLVERGATCNNSNDCRNYNPLHACAYANHPEVAKFFISQKVDLDARTKEFSTPISIAAFRGSYEIVKLLVEAGCNFNVKNARGVTPLHSAIMRNHLKVAEYLLTQDVDVKAATTDKKLPIHVALKSNLFNVVATLINKYKNSVNYQDCLNETPLYMLCKWNHPELVQVFINNGGKIIYDSKHCMNPALSTGSKDVIDVLFKNGVNVHGVLPGGVPFLHRAVQFEQLDIVKMLVAKKVDVNAFSAVKETALMIAAYYDFSEIADFLLKNKADPRLENESNLSALDVAIMKNSLDTFHLLYESLKVEVTDKINPKFKPLHDAAFYGRAVMAKFLIEQKFDVNGLNLNGNTPLHMAASGNHSLIVDILLEHGAHYDSENSENKKPWNLAQDELTVFKLEIIDSLFTYAKEGDYNGCLDCLRRNAFVNARNVYSLTPLHYACQNGFSDIVRLLLDFNADINMTANYGTPLVYAVLFDHYKVVKILLKYGAVYNVATEFGGNSLAYLSGNFDIICLLELIDKVFDAIKKCDTSIVDEIKKIKDLDILHCMLNTRNENKQQLYLEAQNSKFPKEKLVEIYGWEAYLFAQKCN